MAVRLPEIAERDIQKVILQYLVMVKRYFCWRNNTGGFRDKRDHFYQFGKVGSGDIFGLTHEGKFFSVEIKSRKGKVTEHQIAFINSVNASNGIAFIARSLEDVQRAGL